MYRDITTGCMTQPAASLSNKQLCWRTRSAELRVSPGPLVSADAKGSGSLSKSAFINRELGDNHEQIVPSRVGEGCEWHSGSGNDHARMHSHRVPLPLLSRRLHEGI